MAGYYAHITDVQRPSPHNLQIIWEMRNGDLVISQIQSAFQSFIDMANGADTILTAARALVGVNYPAAP